MNRAIINNIIGFIGEIRDKTVLMLTNKFFYKCVLNDTEISEIKAFCEKYTIKYITSNKHELFYDTITNHHFFTMKWIYNKFIHKLKDNGKKFIKTTILCGNVSALNWIFEVVPKSKKNVETLHFNTACQNNSFNVVNLIDKSVKPIHFDGCIDLNTFEIMCDNGWIDLIMWLEAKKYLVLPNHVFEAVCRQKHLNIIKWIYTLGITPQYSIENGFCEACKRNNIHIAKWIFSICEIPKEVINKAFGKSCLYAKNTKLDTLNWLLKVGADNIEAAFVSACVANNLEIMEWIHSFAFSKLQCKIYYSVHFYNSIKIYVNHYTIAFINLCGSHAFDFDIMKWLHSLCTISINEYDNIMFKTACYNMNSDAARHIYLYSDNAQRQLMCNGVFSKMMESYVAVDKPNIELFEWIYSLNHRNINHEKLFRYICTNHKLNVIKWFYGKEKNNVRDFINIAYNECINDKKFEVARWLCKKEKNVVKKIWKMIKIEILT